MKHLPIVDSLRGIASLFVCIFHFALGHGDYLNDYYTLLKICSFGWLGVEMFFVISGFVIPYSMERYGYEINKIWFFLKKRLCRIEPPYIISVLTAFALMWLSNVYMNKNNEISIVQLLLHIGYLNPFFGFAWIEEFYWTLGVEFQFYIFMAIFFNIIFRNKLSFFISIALLCLLPLIKDNYKTFLSYSTFFCYGFIAKEFFLKKLSLKELTLSSVIVFIACLYLFKIEQAIAGILTLAIIILFSNVTIKPLLFLGKISFSLYLTHDIFGGRLINFLNNSHYNIEPLLILVLGLVFSILVAFVFYRLVELPSMILSKKIKDV